MILENIVSDIITLVVAIVGWILLAIQSYSKRKMEKKFKDTDRKYEAYNRFLLKMDEIASEMKKNPQALMEDMTTTLISSIVNNSDDTNSALTTFSKKIISFVSDSLRPMMIMKQELSSLKLVASDKMLTYIHQMEVLTDDLQKEITCCLSTLSPDNADSIQNLKSIGQSERAIAFANLYNEMTALMRKEIQLN